MAPKNKIPRALAAFLVLLAGAHAQFVQVAPGGKSFRLSAACDDFALSLYNSWQVVEAGAGLCCGGADGLGTQLDTAVTNNFNSVRFFGFAVQEGVALQTAPGQYDESVLAGLDTAIALAGERGLKVILALANNWDYTGNSSDNKAWYTNQSTTARSPDDFWTDAEAISDYLAHARFLSRRVNSVSGVAYNEDPTIMALNLINEGRCESSSCTAADIQGWIAQVAPVVKSYFPRQLVTVGQEGFWQADNCAADTTNPVNNSIGWPLQTGQDYLPNHAVEGIDFASIHLLPISWDRTDNTFSTAWLNGHAKQASILAKPLVVETFSIAVDPSKEVTQQNATDLYKLVYAITEASINSDGAIRGVGFALWDAVTTSPDSPGVDTTSIVDSAGPAFVDTIAPYSARINARCVATTPVPAPGAAARAPTAALSARRLLQADAPAPAVDAAALNAEVPADFCPADTVVHAAPSLAPEVEATLAPVADAPLST